MTYFTAVFDGLTPNETVAICNNEKCRFMSHSHVGHERDHWREANRASLAAGEALKERIAEITTDWQVMQENLAACEKDREEQARLNGIGSEREARLMARVATSEKERDLAIAALDARIDICGDERIAKLREMLKTNAEWWYELSDDDKGDACMEVMG